MQYDRNRTSGFFADFCAEKKQRLQDNIVIIYVKQSFA